ncbi:enoyl-ACP reductase FabV [Echinimonas agarilytica]|uniref:Enoyl-[acyl-carrier-protein] reductase [NADH] n=1 Tax=Echinimonas agarilytica TaxID=1215918 RepID=A0AA41W8A4_9GAMM|nr:enoyl-ACP reductase FabV [Echinimonas agarilytica]MCM2681060.1 trans-2-enoyl-CoA reductase family protein [Echinimonas agarilytica]
MIIKPRVRGFICINAHPAGCAESVKQQIEYVRQQPAIEDGPKRVLVIGSSTGYGLASRITSTFGGNAKTVGVFFEKPASEKKTGSAGWYNTAAFHAEAEAAGHYAKSVNGDAFSDEIKQKTIDLIKQDLGQVDLVVYSLASPRRTDPVDGLVYGSVLKPINNSYTARTLDTSKEVVHEMSLEPASEQEIADTVKVMGGEDWERWIDQMAEAGVLAQGARTVAYSYIGKELTWPIYGKATIGRAKEDLDRAVRDMTAKHADLNLTSNVGVLKALVTQASSAIPIMPLYISLLYKVMKELGTHEGCIEQIRGLFDQMYISGPILDEDNRLRVDGKELTDEVQNTVAELWDKVETNNIYELTDYAGYKHEFLKLFGFEFDGVDYEADISPLVDLPLED